MERVQQRSHDLYSPGGVGGYDSNGVPNGTKLEMTLCRHN